MLPLPATALHRTPLYSLHIGLGARMVGFAGYDMPLQYEGIMAEHLFTRKSAGFFDVSHMGQALLTGEGADRALEKLVPSDIVGLAPGQMRYTVLLNRDGGIVDDLMVSRLEGGHLFLVVNAACKVNDYSYIQSALGPGQALEILNDRALLALQGPKAVDILSTRYPVVREMKFMTVIPEFGMLISRSGYTGEDGFEISLPAEEAESFAQVLLTHSDVRPVGLGARDSLRLEAGLCLYGHDIDEMTTPVEAGLNWVVQKRRREEGGFAGAQKILAQLPDKTTRLRVGLRPEGRQPVREGAELTDEHGGVVGVVTSGGFGPSTDAPVAMGYVQRHLAEEGTKLLALVRGKAIACKVAKLPFVKPGYKR